MAGTTYLIDASGLRLDGRSLKVGALLDQGLRRQIAMSSTTPMPTGRSTPRSTGAGQRHYRCTANADRARRHYVFDLGYYDDAPSCWCAWRKPGRKPPPVRLRFARLVRVNLMRRKPLDALLDPEPALIGNLAQRALQWHLS